MISPKPVSGPRDERSSTVPETIHPPEGETGDYFRIADKPGLMEDSQLRLLVLMRGPFVIAQKLKEVVQHDRLGFFVRLFS